MPDPHRRWCVSNPIPLWRNLGDITASEDPSRFLVSCIPDLQSKPDLVDRITPSCYLRLIQTALALTFGLNWPAKLQLKGKARTTGLK